MGEVMIRPNSPQLPPFNSPVEIGLRALCFLSEGFESKFSLQQLIIFDYLLVHSDDIEGGPSGLHPKTPHRSGEILVRRTALQAGLLLYLSRGLIERHFEGGGIQYSASEQSGSFLDSLDSEYVHGLRARAQWSLDTFGDLSELELNQMVRAQFEEWGSEFEMESVLLEENL